MKIEVVKIGAVKLNEANPRTITDERFAKLVKSIKEFPEMLNIRPIVVDASMTVLGGNMRLRACMEAGLERIPIIKAADLTDEQQQRFIIADNVAFGEWDFDALANEWDTEQLAEWGVNVFIHTDVELDNFFEETQPTNENNPLKIVLEFTEEDHTEFTTLLKKFTGTKENILLNLLKNS